MMVVTFRKVLKFSSVTTANQAISIYACKGVWVSAIFSFKTLLGYGFLPKRYINSNGLTRDKETDIPKIYRKECLFAAHV